MSERPFSVDGGAAGEGELFCLLIVQCFEQLLLSCVYLRKSVNEEVFFVISKEGHPGSSGVDSHFDPDGIVPVSREVPFRQIDASCIFPLRFYHSLSASMSDEPGLAQCTSCCSGAQSHKHGIRGSRSFRYPDPFVGGAKWLGVRLPVVSVNSREVQLFRSRANVRRPYSDTTEGVLNFSLVSYAPGMATEQPKTGGCRAKCQFSDNRGDSAAFSRG